MAIITHFDVREDNGQLHPTQVTARVKIIRPPDALPIVRIDTFGSQERKLAGKMSQTIQFIADSARELHSILARVYGL